MHQQRVIITTFTWFPRDLGRKTSTEDAVLNIAPWPFFLGFGPMVRSSRSVVKAVKMAVMPDWAPKRLNWIGEGRQMFRKPMMCTFVCHRKALPAG